MAGILKFVHALVIFLSLIGLVTSGSKLFFSSILNYLLYHTQNRSSFFLLLIFNSYLKSQIIHIGVLLPMIVLLIYVALV